MLFRSRFLLQTALFIPLVSVLALATVQATKYSNYNELRHLSGRLEEAPQSRATPTDVSLALVTTMLASRECQARFLLPAVTISLTALDKTPAKPNTISSDAGLQTTSTLIHHALGCRPTSGNLWLRSAMVADARGADTRSVLTSLSLSQRLSPASDRAIYGRYLLFNRLSRKALAFATGAITQDLRLVCSQFVPKWFKLALPPSSEAFASIAATLVPYCRMNTQHPTK